MRWAPAALPALVAACALLWVDALAGGRLAGSTAAVVLVAALALLAGLRTTTIVLVAGTLVAVALLTVADQIGSPGQFALGNDGVFYSVVVLAPALLGWLTGDRNRQVAELEASRAALHTRRVVAVRLAREEERERVQARVDAVLASRLHAIAAASRALGTTVVGTASAPAAVQTVEEAARDALTDLREVLGDLHDDVPHDDVPITEPPVEHRPASPWRGRGSVALDVALLLSCVPLAVETVVSGTRGPAAFNVVCALAQGVALVLARRRLLTGIAVLFAVAAVQSAFAAALPPTISWLVTCLATVFVVGQAPGRRIAAFVLTLGGAGLVTVVTPAADRALDGFLPGVIMTGLVLLGSRHVAVRARRAHQLREHTAELERTRDQQARLAAVEQRVELARELHDVGAHALTVVCLQAGAARTWWTRDTARAGAALAAVLSVADTTLDQLGAAMNAVSGRRSAMSTEPLTGESLDLLAGVSRALGLDVDIDVDAEVTSRTSNAADVGRVAYRVVQEALTNTARHAGQTSVAVRLRCAEDTLEVRVTDAGGGRSVVAVPGSGLGLRGMRERVEALRGELRAGPSGDGFEVVARLPV